MKLYLSIFLLLLSFTTKAQELNINTTHFVGGDSSCGGMGNSYAISTKDGGILFFGSTICYNGGGDIPPNFADTTEPGTGNVLVGKLDSNMNVSWVKVYGGTAADYGKSAVQTGDGGYAVLCYTASDDVDVTGNHGTGDAADLWLLRLDSLGNLLWQRCYGSAYDEEPGSIALTPDNGFIMFGVSNGSGDDVPSHYGSEFDEDWFVVKADSLGSIQWTKSMGGTNNEHTGGNILVADGGYYLVSSSNSTDHDCTDTAWHPGHSTGDNYFIFRLDTAGNILWDSSYGGGNDEAAVQAIWDSRDSSIIVIGFTLSTDYMVVSNHGSIDMWLIKTAKNGTLNWTKCLGGPNDDEGASVVVTNAGYIAYGSTDPGDIGQQDAWIFAIDLIGNQITDKQFGGIGYEFPNSVFTYKEGYVGAGTTNSINFTEGSNIGHLPGVIGETFLTYINYWPLSVQNISSQYAELKIYPNPSRNYINIVLPDNNVGLLKITNCIGDIAFIETGEKDITINTAAWAKGLYIVKWQGADGTVLVSKLIIN
jgi:hypothetical protein